MPVIRILLALILFATAGGALAGNVEVRAIEMTVADPNRSTHFYTEVLQFDLKERSGSQNRQTVELRLGDDTLLLRQVPPDERQTMPRDVAANDTRFQHIAIVVSDIDAAYRRLLASGVSIVSAGPQTLPAWNYDAGGIRALYFRDPDGHFLELIQFPDNKGEPKWHRSSGSLFLGIDHTAIVVRDVEDSLHFYRSTLGMTMTGRSLNYGMEQDALNGLRGSRVKIVSLRGARGPGVELLQYLSPSSEMGVAVPATNDLLRWQIKLNAPGHGRAGASALAHDPDGHALALLAGSGAASSAELMLEALRQHWPRYLMEGAELGIFMIVTLCLTLLLEHPSSPIRQRLRSPLARRMLMGAGIGGTVIALIYSDWGRLSGAQFNPSVTLAYLSLGRIEPWDAAFYIIAQIIGGWLGLALAELPVRQAAAQIKVNHVLTQPGDHRAWAAFSAEFLISFVLLFSLLNVFHQSNLKPWIGFIAGLHLWLFISFEAPFSGMSLNPARSLASALAAGDFRKLWIYFIAPPAAMQLAAFLCRRWIGS